MWIPNSDQTGDEYFHDNSATPAMKTILSRPNYDKLWAEYQLMSAKMLPKKPLDRKSAWNLAHAQLDFQDALMELQYRTGFGTVILRPDDSRNEHLRVTNAVICLHDYLRLYKEIIRQPPPNELNKIEQILINRQEDLNRLYKLTGHLVD